MARGVHETEAITSYVSTRWYRAPEILMMSKTYSTPVDIFAIGCIFGEMHTGKPLFPGFDEVDQLRKIFSVMGTPTVGWQEGVELLEKAYRVVRWPPKSIELQEKTSMHGDALHLLSGLLRLNPRTRLTADIALKHSLFQQKQWSPMMTTTPITTATPTGNKKLPVAVTVSPKSKSRYPLH